MKADEEIAVITKAEFVMAARINFILGLLCGSALATVLLTLLR